MKLELKLEMKYKHDNGTDYLHSTYTVPVWHDPIRLLKSPSLTDWPNLLIGTSGDDGVKKNVGRISKSTKVPIEGFNLLHKF